MINNLINKNLTDFYNFYGSKNGVFYVGHASVLVSLNGRKILFDPIILSKPYGDSWTFFPLQVVDPRMFDVDAVFVSHIHQDHYDVEFLKALDGRIPTIIIGGRVSFEDDLRANGVKNVQIIEPEVITEIFDGIFVFGVVHESNGIDASAIIFNDDFCIYHGNDNYIKSESLSKFKAVKSHINVACIPYAYIHWYPFLMEYDLDKLPEKEAEGNRLTKIYMDDFLNSVRILGPEIAIPFGANLLLDDGNAYSDINFAVKTPIELCQYIATQDPLMGDVCKPMLAGDYCGVDNGGIKVTIARIFESQEYRDIADAHLKSMPKKTPSRDWQPINRRDFIDSLNSKLKKIDNFVNEGIFIDLSYLGNLMKLQIDLQHRKAEWVEEFDRNLEFHHFMLDLITSGEWLNGKRFEEILGMRRFSVRRVPNIYKPAVLKVINTVL